MVVVGKKRQRVWQDIRPAKAVIATPPKKPVKKRPQIVKRSLAYIRTHKKQSIIVGAVIIAVLLILAFMLFRPKSTALISTASLPDASKNPTLLVPGTPSYDTLIPQGKSIKDLGGGLVRNDKNPLFVYVDKIGNVSINVSEQPLPESFKPAVNQHVKDLAVGFGASTRLTIDGNTVYIGTYEKGLQRVIFSKNDLLILMSANTNISSADWSSYISSLQ